MNVMAALVPSFKKKKEPEKKKGIKAYHNVIYLIIDL